MATEQWKQDNIDKMRQYRKDWYYKNREKSITKAAIRNREFKDWFADFKKSLSCLKCGEDHPAALDFHHRNPLEKDMEVSNLISKGNKQKILDEISKCDVLCSNCHRKLHYEEKHPL